ncbi:calumenin-A isoform X1 [Patella vulgata]|uniref:calumenin-A isoform X1 n=1 Tax=Patella vulgata TaxID=6465 RepID=UPI00217F64EB|nr:calumenin-A isoform X1 [Patella vulgata]
MVVLKKKEMMQCYTFFLLIIVVVASAIPTKADDQKKRVKEKSLSDASHSEDGEHNNDYDHEAFLGKEERQTFDQLSPEESRDRLGKIFEKIDKNSDGFVSEDELKDWIQYVQKRYITTDTERMWKDYDISDTNEITWNAYMKRTYGYGDAGEPKEGDPVYEYRDMITRDKRRWERADGNNDDKLNKEEFSNFLHPEDAEHMREIVVLETLEDIDKDKDGFISVEEYIADIYDEADEDDDEEDGHHEGGEPEWVQAERDQFANTRDKNGDGKLNKEEIRDWIIPEDYDHVSAEVEHLIHSSDEDKDGRLTKQEILDKHDLFVGSQATDFGEALTRHDEF